jgi:hypothetical protein
LQNCFAEHPSHLLLHFLVMQIAPVTHLDQVRTESCFTLAAQLPRKHLSTVLYPIVCSDLWLPIGANLFWLTIQAIYFSKTINNGGWCGVQSGLVV